MRFDSTPYYHLGSVYPWDKMVDEMRDEARLSGAGRLHGGLDRRAPFRMGWLARDFA